jgi:arabinogalactan oligomer/maltooligosaccharide transport system permease protein
MYFKHRKNQDLIRSGLASLWAILGLLFELFIYLIIIIPNVGKITVVIGNSSVITAAIIYIILVALFTHQSLVVAIADKKGQDKTKAGFIGLIPVFGLYHYLKMEPVRPLSSTAIKSILNLKNILGTMVIYGEMIALAFVVVIPIIYAMGTSLSPNAGILNTIWPKNPSWVNYEFLLTGEREIGGIIETTYFTKWYGTTFIVALITMVGAVIFVTGTAYVFARYNFKGKKAGLLTILVLQMFPTFLSLIAIFTLFQTFELTNNPYALPIIYVSGGIPFNIWLIKGYLMNIPKELDESAKIDGANKLQIFTKIILPLSVPILSFVAVTSFMSPWMDYILPSFLIPDSEKWTLAVGIFDFINDASDTNYPAFAAAALMVALPITILYVTFQRYLIEGITAGANKG